MEAPAAALEDGQWQCEACTLINTAAERACHVCDTPRPRPKKRQRESWACPCCTLVNDPKDKYCEACDTRRPKRGKERGSGDGGGDEDAAAAANGSMDVKLPASSTPPAGRGGVGKGSGDEEEEDDGSHLAARECFVTSVLFPMYVEGNAGSAEKKQQKGQDQPQQLRCLLCGKQHSTAGIMRAHFIKTHLAEFGQDLSAGNAAAMAALRMQADERLALLALAEEEGEEEEEAEEGAENGSRRPPSRNSVEGAVAVADGSVATSSAARRGQAAGHQRQRRKRQRQRRVEEEEDDESDSEAEGSFEGESEEEGPTTRSGRTLVYSAAAMERHAVLRESMREMESRKQRRLEVLVERTTALLGRLQRDIAALVGGGGAGGGGGGGVEATAGTAAAASSIRPQRLRELTLRDYQEQGVSWLLSLHAHGLNGILADEMGLGKTLQVLAFLCLLQERTGAWGPHLVVAPLSVLSSWEKEIERAVAGARCHVYHGEKQERKEAFLRAVEEWRGQGAEGEGGGGGPVIVLTSFEMVLRDEATLRLGGKKGLEWAYCVVDEAHRLKNRQGKLLAAMQSLRARHRLLLTGTPLQNDLGELFSLLCFVQPSLFKRVHTLQDWFNQPFEAPSSLGGGGGGEQQPQRQKELREVQLTREEEEVVIGQLHTVLRPFLLRRTKAQVLAALPSKEERVVHCPLSALQIRLYHLLQDGCQAAAAAHKACNGSSPSGPRQSISTANLLMQLRKLCGHPFLLMQDTLDWDADLAPVLLSASGKLLVLDRILARLKALGRRVLIFSQLTSMLDILEAFMQERSHEYLRLDGATKAEERPGLIDEFNAPNSPVFAFLISTRAGGLGLNLQSADTVIIYDSDWNPQSDLQAQARCHRIGQTNDVLVLRLVSVGPDAHEDGDGDEASGSVEEHMLAVARTKLERERRIIEAGKFTLAAANGAKDGEEEEKETDARAELQSFLELQCVKRASRAEAAAAIDDRGKPPSSSGLQLQQLLARERLDAVTARDETDLARLREMRVDENDEEAAAALAGAAQLPPWLGLLEDEMLGRNSKEPAWGQQEPDAKRRRVTRFDSLSDAAIYRQRQREGEEEEEEREKGGGKGNKKEKMQKKREPAAGRPSSGGGARLVPAPADATCVKCLVEEASPQGVGTVEEELALVLCPGCDNPFHRACLGPGHECMFCEGEE